jgi:hypothetical protein
MLEIQRRGMLVGILVVVVGGVGGVRGRCSRSRMLVFTHCTKKYHENYE